MDGETPPLARNGIATVVELTADDTAVVIENVRIMRFESDLQSPKFLRYNIWLQPTSEVAIGYCRVRWHSCR